MDDENDNAPIFSQSLYEGKIKENSPPLTEVQMQVEINATDKDKGINSQFSLTLFGEGQDIFQINQTTGKVIYKGNELLDREIKSSYNFRLVARDKGSLSSEARLIINIEDENDNAPTFLQMIILPDQGVKLIEYDDISSNLTKDVLMMGQKKKEVSHAYVAPLVSLPENTPVGTPIIRLLADDRDSSQNAIITYELISETLKPILGLQMEPRLLSQYFAIHASKGEVIIARALVAETEFRLNVSATDRGNLSDYLSIRLYVTDVNDHAPVFKKPWYSFDAVEAHYSRTILGKIEATDADYGSNANVTYKILNDTVPFGIVKSTGVLTINGELDREKTDNYTFIVQAQDNPNEGNPKKSIVSVEVNILDVNDNSPVFYGYDEIIPTPNLTVTPNHNFASVLTTPIYYASVPENSPTGTAVTRIFANDSDFQGNGNGLLLFHIPHKKNQPNLFAIDSKDGIVTTLEKLDFENQSTHNVTIIASDLGSPSLSSTALLVVKVLDVAEDHEVIEHPVLAHRYYEVEVEENIKVPLKLLTLNISAEFENKGLQFTIVSENGGNVSRMYKIDKSGTLYLLESPDREVLDKFELRIKVDRLKVVPRGMVYPVVPEKLSELGKVSLVIVSKNLILCFLG